jgi:hypothetical protein
MDKNIAPKWPTKIVRQFWIKFIGAITPISKSSPFINLILNF